MRIPVLAAALVVAALPALAAAPAVPVLSVGTAFAPAALVVPLGTAISFESTFGDHYVATGTYDAASLTGVPNDLSNEDEDPDTFGVFVGEGDAYVHVFSRPGEFPYYCVVHETTAMIGSILVV